LDVLFLPESPPRSFTKSCAVANGFELRYLTTRAEFWILRSCANSAGEFLEVRVFRVKVLSPRGKTDEPFDWKESAWAWGTKSFRWWRTRFDSVFQGINKGIGNRLRCTVCDKKAWSLWN
jgi:hypothetical protein